MSINRYFQTSLVAGILISEILTAAPEKREITIRALLHDPVKGNTNIFIPNGSGKAVPLSLRAKALSAPQSAEIFGGKLLLLSSLDADPTEPGDQLAGTATIPASLQKAIVLIFAAPSGKLKTLVFSDSSTDFPPGSSRLINVTTAEIAVQAGEHRLAAKPGGMINIPPVTKINSFNLAQTNFYSRKQSSDQWEPFAERQLKYLNTTRRIFIVHVTPGATAPAVSTIIDMAPSMIPTE